MRSQRAARRHPWMRAGRALSLACASMASAAGCDAGAQQADAPMVVSSDPVLAELAAELLPDLARRSGLELREPVRLHRRSRDELVRYLEFKLDEDLPESRARALVESYALLGLVPADLDLREVLMALYTEQVAGFYEPDSTALFVLDDQPEEGLEALLIHELVHAVQDQSADLDRLTDPERGNDRTTAAQAAIEGHATLVMIEYMAEKAGGGPVDLGRIPDFGSRVRPALEAMADRFPALAGAPLVIRESLLFPYVEGASWVQGLWTGAERRAPFGELLPESTEQVITGEEADAPVDLEVEVDGGTVVHSDVLGRLETGVLLEVHAGEGRGEDAAGWGGDRYVLVAGPGGGRGLVWWSVWDDAEARDRVVGSLRPVLSRLGTGATLDAVEVDGRAAAVVRVGSLEGVRTMPRISRAP